MDATPKRLISLHPLSPLTVCGVTLHLLSGTHPVSIEVAPAAPGEFFDGSGTTNPTGLIGCMQIRGTRK